MALKKDPVDFDSYESRVRMTPISAREEAPSGNPYLLLLLSRWKTIAMVTLLSVVATFIYTKWIATKWYQATAIIVPVPEGAIENRVQGGVGSFGTSGMASLILQSGTDTQAQQYMTILRSFAFNTGLAIKHNLTADLLGDDPSDIPKSERQLKMKLFDAASARFSVDYSIHAQNLSVHFVDKDPLAAQKILESYLSDLRELQRQEAIRSATAAIASLNKEAKETGDMLLSEELYRLVANQVQRQKLAEVEADFAFRVLEPPISPDKPYWPRARINCFIALMLTPMLAGIVILLLSLRSGWRPQSRPALPATQRPRAIGEIDSLN